MSGNVDAEVAIQLLEGGWELVIENPQEFSMSLTKLIALFEEVF
jgi:hypothetical protein